MELDTLTEAIDALVDAGAENFGDPESMEVLHRQLSRLESFTTEASAAFEVQGDWTADGAKTAASWIATRCHVPRGAARRRGQIRSISSTRSCSAPGRREHWMRRLCAATPIASRRT